MSEGLALTITVAGQDYPGRLPIMPIRYSIINAWRDCVKGAVDKDDDDMLNELDDLAAICMAAIALCWAGEPFKVEYWHEEDIVEEVELDEIETDADGAAVLNELDEPVYKTEKVERHVAEMRSVWIPAGDRLFRILDRDVIRFGEHVQGGLTSVGLVDYSSMFHAGRKLFRALTDSVPKAAEVEQAAADFSSPAGGSTSTSVGSA